MNRSQLATMFDALIKNGFQIEFLSYAAANGMGYADVVATEFALL